MILTCARDAQRNYVTITISLFIYISQQQCGGSQPDGYDFINFTSSWVITLVPQRFSFAVKRQGKRERKKRREKSSGSGRCKSHYHARESINKQPITSHLSVNTKQSEYAYKVPPIRRQGQTLVQIHWRGKISQLSRTTRGFLTFLSSLLAASWLFS